MSQSKAARIRELYAQGLGTAEIAKVVGCKPEYVRVAGRQRKDGPSPHDKRWHGGEPYRAWARQYQSQRWATDPEYRRRNNEASARYRAKNRALAADANRA